MRILNGCIYVAGALVIAGCGKEEPQAPAAHPPPAQDAAMPNRDGYLGTVVHGQQVAVKAIDTASLNQEVQLFNVQEGRFPKDLNELVAKQYIGKLPDAPAGMKLNYDAASGKVTVVPQ